MGPDLQRRSAADKRQAAWMARCVGRGELAPFSESEIRDLAATVGTTRAEAGTPLMHEGQEVAQIGLIMRGEVELYRRTPLRRVVLQVLRPGDVFGDIPVLCRKPPPFGARALTDTEVVLFEAEQLWLLLERHPIAIRRFLYSVASRLERMQGRLLELTAGDLRHQVAALVLDETEVEPVVRLSQSTIAELLGATRPSVNRVLKQLESDGMVELAYRRVEVVDRDGLEALVG